MLQDDGYNYDRTVQRSYRGALVVLGRAVDWWLGQRIAPEFIAQLGDLIDGSNAKSGTSDSALEAALVNLRRVPFRVVNLIGNQFCPATLHMSS